MDILYIILIVICIGYVLIKVIKPTQASSKTNYNMSKEDLANYTVPEKYKAFPTYDGILFTSPKETITYGYDRLTLVYEGPISNSFLDKLYFEGFSKGSNVRYDKENTYVIVERIDDFTKIAYHIKK